MRQYSEKRNASIHHKTGLPRYNIFSHPLLSTVEYSSGYLLFNTRVYLQKNQGPQFEENDIIAKHPKCGQLCASFQSSSKINRMLITRLMVYSYPQFLRSPLGTPGTMIHHLARTHEKKKEKETPASLESRS